ncbi:MAG TPA: DUF11 domain-containing protein [Pirellulales bacterium]
MMLSTTPVGILLLDPKPADSLLSSSTGGVHVTGGSLVIDSKNALAGVDAGIGNVSAAEIDVTGKLKAYGPGQFQGSVLHPSPLADPLATLPVPLAANPVQKLVNASGNASLTLSPGTYAGILISGNAKVNLLPGVYVLKGSGLRVLGNGQFTGTGVTIYNAPKNAAGEILITPGATVALSAPTSGTFKNIVLFQDRASTVPIVLSGGHINLAGKVYAAKARLNVVGTANLNIGATAAQGITSELIVDDLTTTGLASIHIDATPGSITDVAVSISGPPMVTAGANATYIVTVTNNGPEAAFNVQLTDAIPAGGSFVSETQTTGPAFSFTNPPVGSAGTVNNSIVSLAAGATATFQIIVRENPSAADSSSISDTANVAISGLDTNTANNSATTTATVNTSADLVATITGPATAMPGDTVTYHITVTNNGPSDANGVGLVISASGHVGSGSLTQTSGPSLLDPLPSGGTETFDIAYTVDSNAADNSTIVNTVDISSPTTDPNTANNSATANTTVMV